MSFIIKKLLISLKHIFLLIGDPALLYHLISVKELGMTYIEMLNIEDFNDIARKCSMKLPSGPSKLFFLPTWNFINFINIHLVYIKSNLDFL